MDCDRFEVLFQVEKSTSENIPKLKPFPAPVRSTGNDRPVSSTPSSSIATSISNPTPTVVIENHPDLLGLGMKSNDSIRGLPLR